jgi:ABC-2 type transport system permease protein
VLGNALALYRRYAWASLRSQLATPTALAVTSIGTLLVTASEFAAIWGLFLRFGQLRGWRLPEIALLYGLISITWSLADAVSRGLDSFGQLVKTGDFDRILVRPRSTILQLLGEELTLRRVGRLAQGVAVFGWAIAAGDIPWTLGRIALVPLAIGSGICVFLGLLVLQATSAFWTVETLEVWSAFTYGGVTVSQYPLPIYRAWFRALFIYVIPLGAALYFPGVAILGRPDPLGAPARAGWLAPLAGPAFLAACLQVWRVGVRHYRSTGS